MTLAFVTYGCRLNRAETLDLEARCTAAGCTIVPLPEAPGAPAPDIIVVRGCSVTAAAQHTCEKDIARLRRRFPAARLITSGCLPGAESLDAVLALPPNGAAVSRRTSRAYLKIQDGCNGACAFCTVPHFRGPSVSTPFADVLAHARAFVSAGFREIVVTGCNLALYRHDGHHLADVLDALASLTSPDGPPRIRLSSLEPSLCDEAILDVFSRHANICRFLHLSLQSAADSVLRAMRRPYTIARVHAFCDAARARLGPHVALGADVIAGFPGETPEDHAATCAFLDAQRFAKLHVFPYSERPGTPAATFSGALAPAVRRARARALETLGRRHRQAFAQQFAGRDVEVCVENDGHGWTGEYLRCRLPDGLPRRALVRVHVAAVQGDVLIAEGAALPRPEGT